MSARRMRTRMAAGVVLIGLVLAGCSDDDSGSDDANSSMPETSESSDATSSSPAAPEQGGLCDVVSTSDVVDAFGVEIDDDAIGTGSADEQGNTWKYRTCSWETPGQIEVTLGIATAADFPDGTLGGPPLAYLGTPGEPVVGLDADAWWVESGFNEEEGTLRVCTDAHLFDIDVDRPSGTVALDLLQEQAAELASRVLTALGT